MAKFKVYVYSVRQVPTVDFVDKEGAIHACAQAGNMPFETLSHCPANVDAGLLSVEERTAIANVGLFCKENDHKFEIVDFARLSFISKLKLRRKGVKSFPTISVAGANFTGIPTEDVLEKLATA